MTRASDSMIPVVGQAVLGFVLPWVLAMVAIPLEMLLDSTRHVLASIGVLLLQALGHLARIVSHSAAALARMLANLYDVYVSIPLRIERAMRGGGRGGDPGSGPSHQPGHGPRTREATAS